MELTTGLRGEARGKVDAGNTAVKYGSGSVDVFATPAMIGLMEKAALTSVDSLLGEGMATVGIALDVKHLAATPMGMEVVATSELVEIDGKRLVFRVEAWDGKEKIGEGTHQRYIISLAKFMEKVRAKAGI
ncbi:MAG: thioesterase family protein [Bacillota bacterium]